MTETTFTATKRKKSNVRFVCRSATIVDVASMTNIANTSYANGSTSDSDYSASLDGGTIYGRAIRGLFGAPKDIPERGMGARLVPWI